MKVVPDDPASETGVLNLSCLTRDAVSIWAVAKALPTIADFSADECALDFWIVR